MMKKLKLGLLVLFLLAVAGCSSTGDVADSDGNVVVEDQSSTDTSSATGYEDSRMQSLDDPTGVLSHRVIYFGYDSYDVNAQDRELLAAHANYLVSHPAVSVRLEGHADERGSREYNIGLGDRRNQAVKRVLELQGVSPNQITMISYGEEKPAVEGHDESAWSLNRRVELVYVGN